MFAQYPDQSAARKGFAFVACLFLCFAIVVAFFEAWFLVLVGVAAAAILGVPAVFLGHAAFAKAERILARLFAG